MDDTPGPAVEAIGLHKEFGDVVAVDRLDLRVEAGSFFGFLGPNGAGKSTTIKILTGMTLPTSGKAAILGHDVVDDAVAAKQITGVVSEDGALFERLTGAEYLEFVGRMYGMERETIRERSNELLELMDLAGDSAKLIVDYSHGMQKKLGFAAALIHDPEVLFLDEPFEGIDAVTGLIVLGSMSVLLSMMGNFTSVAFPESRPVSSLTSSASPTGTLMMIGCLLLGVTLGGIVVFGAAMMKLPALQPVLALVVFAAVGCAYRLTLSPAARTLSDRRDEVFHALGAGYG